VTSITRIMPVGLARTRAPRVIERNIFVYRRTWIVIFTGFFEPLFYLLGLGFGLGSLIGTVNGYSYAVFVAPALMATSSMNGAIYDSTFNMFYKLKYAKTYDAMLSTPLGVADVAIGEVTWALTRGAIYSVSFMIVMLVLGLVPSPWGLLAVPASLLIGFAAAGLGTAATSFVRKWQDFDLVFVITLPLFLFSGTFFPIETYPEPLRFFVELTPLYRGVHMLRSLTIGDISPLLLVDAGYLIALGVIGATITSRRLGRLLLK